MRTVSLYYESPDLLLAPERRNLPLPQNPAAALDLVMRELLKGSANAAVPRLLPADTTIRGAYLLPEGTAFVDLGGPTLTQVPLASLKSSAMRPSKSKPALKSAGSTGLIASPSL